MGAGTRKTRKATTPAREVKKETWAQIRQTVYWIQSAVGRYVGMSQARGVLFHCIRHDEEMSQTAIQQRLQVDRSEVTRIVQQLETDGLVTRHPDPADHRFTLVQLTEAGCAVQKDIIARYQKADDLLLQGLSRADMLCTARTLARIRENAERLAAGGGAEDAPRSKTRAGRKPLHLKEKP